MCLYKCLYHVLYIACLSYSIMSCYAETVLWEVAIYTAYTLCALPPLSADTHRLKRSISHYLYTCEHFQEDLVGKSWYWSIELSVRVQQFNFPHSWKKFGNRRHIVMSSIATITFSYRFSTTRLLYMVCMLLWKLTVCLLQTKLQQIWDRLKDDDVFQ